ncbi:MAG: YggU family protein [Candidatus Bathyarchaeota archaeon]|nr:MAG: YggU family protein [Candidatus Bathyarchaeota archaeon]
MKLQDTDQGVVIDIYVKPNSKQFQLKVEDNELVVYCREAPVKGRVNRELIKGISRILKKKVEILSGVASRHKKILIRDATGDDVRTTLS